MEEKYVSTLVSGVCPLNERGISSTLSSISISSIPRNGRPVIGSYDTGYIKIERGSSWWLSYFADNFPESPNVGSLQAFQAFEAQRAEAVQNNRGVRFPYYSQLLDDRINGSTDTGFLNFSLGDK